MILSGPPSDYGYHRYKSPPWIRGIGNFRVDPKASAHAALAAKEPHVASIVSGLLPQKGIIPGEIPRKPHTQPRVPVSYNPGVRGLNMRKQRLLPGRRG